MNLVTRDDKNETTANGTVSKRPTTGQAAVSTTAGPSRQLDPSANSQKEKEADKMTASDEKASQKTEERRERLIQRVLLLLTFGPYVIGVAWHCVHPFANVTGGNFQRPHGIYIDENSLDPSAFGPAVPFRLLTEDRRQQEREKDENGEMMRVSSLCDALSSESKDGFIGCIQSPSQPVDATQKHLSLEIARIIPSAVSVVPVSETIVIVVPPAEDWYQSQFHYSLLELMSRLTSPEKVTWLAKTIVFVAPVYDKQVSTYDTNGTSLLLQDTVDSFLDLYMGENTVNSFSLQYPRTTELLKWTAGSMIRNLLVFDVESKDPSDEMPTKEIRILPQGRRGVVPNLDLFSVCIKVYEKNPRIKLLPHPHSESVDRWWKTAVSYLPEFLHNWVRSMFNLLAFEYMLTPILHPSPASFPPHMTALDRGIDALTIQGVIKGGTVQAQDQTVADIVSRTELIIRALSNLHERLHHSTSLYLMVSASHFVKHEEYLVPNLLLVIPLIVRAATLIFMDISRFQISAAQRALSVASLGVLGCTIALPLLTAPSSSSQTDLSWSTWVLSIAYIPVILGAVSSRPKVSAGLDSVKTVQFVTCLIGIYIHLPIAFGHVALAFPSALFWTPLIAFPKYEGASRRNSVMASVVRWTLFFATFPAVFLVPRLIPTYTPYVLFAYLPLHLLVSILWLN